MNKVEKFIQVIRDSFIGSQQVYTEGSCYHFYKILKQVFPEAECWYNQDHIITKIDDEFYDITGKISVDYIYEKIEENDSPTSRLQRPFNIYNLK